MSGENNEPTDNAILAAYQAVNQHWAHAEQERWSILYNFLMANTILLLAWAAVYASQVTAKVPVLLVLSLGGVVISGLWLTIGCRANTFIRRYGELGEAVEDKLRLDRLGPFHRGEVIRAEAHAQKAEGTHKSSAMERLGSYIPSRIFVLIVPSLFAGVYLVLFILSWPPFVAL